MNTTRFAARYLLLFVACLMAGTALFAPTPAVSESFEAAPFEAAPFEAAPFEAAPFEAAPFEAAPFEAAPFEAAPFEAAPFEAAPFEAAPCAVSLDNATLDDATLTHTPLTLDPHTLMSYDLTDHPLLSATTATLAEDVLAAQTRVAERVLGLDGQAFTGDDHEAAKDALALQVSFQVDQLPDRDAGTLLKERRGDRSFEWRDTPAHPAALRMAQRLTGHDRPTPPVAAVKPAAPTVPDASETYAQRRKPFGFEIT